MRKGSDLMNDSQISQSETYDFRPSRCGGDGCQEELEKSYYLQEHQSKTEQT